MKKTYELKKDRPDYNECDHYERTILLRPETANDSRFESSYKFESWCFYV